MSEISAALRAVPQEIGSGGQLTVTLELSASPRLAASPADIVLVLDRSACLSPGENQAMQQAAASLLCSLALSAGGSSISGMGLSRAGLVSFGSTAVIDCPLTGDVTAVRQALGRHTLSGSPNLADGICTAMTLFGARPQNRKILLLFAAGLPETDPLPALEAARAAGAELYCIGLDLKADLLDLWTDVPDGSHSFAAAGADQLMGCFSRAALAISGPGALDVLTEQVISPEFRLLKVVNSSRGVARITGENQVRWQISSLGARRPQTAELTLLLQHTGSRTGTLTVHSALTYQDSTGGSIDPAPLTVLVRGSGPEPRPVPVCFDLDSCRDSACVDLGELIPEDQGRVIQLSVTLKQLCPNKRVGLALVLTQVDEQGQEHPCGMKTLMVPAHGGEGCQDVTLHCIRFVVPEAAGEGGASLCGSRSFRVRAMANYLDTDFTFCDC